MHISTLGNIWEFSELNIFHNIDHITVSRLSLWMGYLLCPEGITWKYAYSPFNMSYLVSEEWPHLFSTNFFRTMLFYWTVPAQLRYYWTVPAPVLYCFPYCTAFRNVLVYCAEVSFFILCCVVFRSEPRCTVQLLRTGLYFPRSRQR